MLDFRRSVLALAALLSIGSGSAAGQVGAPLTCVAQAAGTPTVRAEGVAELVGDVLILCNGGVPTPANESLRQVNFQIFAQPSINITSRQLAGAGTGNFSEALLFIDEPSPANQTLCGSGAYPYSVPAGSGQTLISGNCGAHAGTGNGIGTYNPNVTAPVITSAQTYRGNAYQARQISNNSLVWQGIPFDPPGNLTTRWIRITNAGKREPVGSSCRIADLRTAPHPHEPVRCVQPDCGADYQPHADGCDGPAVARLLGYRPADLSAKRIGEREFRR